MYLKFLSIILLFIFTFQAQTMLVSANELGAAEEGPQKVLGLLKEYSNKLGNAISLIKENKVKEGEEEVNSAKESLNSVTKLLQTDKLLSGLPAIGPITSQLSQLSSLTNTLNMGGGNGLDGVLGQFQSVFAVLGQVKEKVSSVAPIPIPTK